jgi:hypothetical protein
LGSKSGDIEKVPAEERLAAAEIDGKDPGCHDLFYAAEQCLTVKLF